MINNGAIRDNIIRFGIVSSVHRMSLSDADIHRGSFEPTIVAGLGYAGNQAQLMSVPPFAVTFIRTYLNNEVLVTD